MRPRALPLSAALLVALAASSASAQRPSVDVRNFTPPTDPNGSLSLEPTSTPGAGNFNTSALFSWSLAPAVLRTSDGSDVGKLVSQQLAADVLANLGVTSRGAIGVDVPFVLRQWGDSNAFTARAMEGSTLAGTALGDLALVGKANLVRRGELGGFGLSALGRLTLPTGSRTAFVGEGAPTSELRLLAEYSLIALSFEATAGFKLRTEERDFLNRTYGNEIPFGAAIVLRPQALGWDDKGRWTWAAELHGSKMLPPSSAATDRGQFAPVSPVLAGLSARYAIGDVSLFAGAETAITKALGDPEVRVVAGLSWAPRTHDMDHDGVPDDVDQCPELPEDRDGFEDSDGCPDWDNDDDQVADADDKCPTQKEDIDDFQDDDGCPDPDDDGDGIPDEEDACPQKAGPKSDNPKSNGCPRRDRDGDGLSDKHDKCPDEPEDKDGFEDDDGCPDPDDDQDGVPDAEDACPREAGERSDDPKRNGCPIPDRDRDTFDDAIDKCPDAAEVWNGKQDDDGCPDEGGKLLVTVDDVKGQKVLRLAKPVKFAGTKQAPAIDPASAPTLRAIAQTLHAHPSWIVAIGVRPAGTSTAAENAALARAFVAVQALRSYAHRDGVAETVGWKAVEKVPGAAAAGLGFLLLGTEEEGANRGGAATQGEAK